MAAPYLGCHNVLAELGAPVLPPLPLQGAQERITYLDELLKSHLDLHRDVRGRWVFLSHTQTKVRKESSLTWVTISFFFVFFSFLCLSVFLSLTDTILFSSYVPRVSILLDSISVSLMYMSLRVSPPCN